MTLPCHQNPVPKKNGALFQLILLGLLLLALLASASWYQQTQAPQADVMRHDCDLQQGACHVELSNGRLQLEAGPRPLRSLSPLNLALGLEGVEASRIRVDLQGAEMYMGINRFELQRGSDARWHGQTELAVCTTGSMLWQLTVEIETPKGPEQHLFEFEAR